MQSVSLLSLNLWSKKKKSSLLRLNVFFLSDLFLALAFKWCTTCDVINLYDLELFLRPHLRQIFIFFPFIHLFYFGSAVPKGPSDLWSADWPLQNSRRTVPACLGAAVKKKKKKAPEGRINCCPTGDEMLSEEWKLNAEVVTPFPKHTHTHYHSHQQKFSQRQRFVSECSY